jgi:hypothetical protein
MDMWREIIKWNDCESWRVIHIHHHHHYHHHVYEGLGVFPVPWSSKWNSSLHLFLGRPMFLRPFGLYCITCFGILFVSILCTCCSHFSWYCFISFTIFCYSYAYYYYSILCTVCRHLFEVSRCSNISIFLCWLYYVWGKNFCVSSPPFRHLNVSFF